MMSPHDFSIALRIRHPSIDPAEITQRLGIEPQHAWRAGEPREIDAGEVGSSVHRETYWVGLLPARPTLGPVLGPQAVRVEELLGGATSHPQVALYFTLLRMKRTTDFWRTFAEQGGTVECLLQVHKPERFQLDLSQALLLALVELKIALSIEVDGGLRAAA
jgi:hypothetical protein